MGEIKSTLDLVMEKTRNMKMSSEERLAQKQRDLEQRIHGLLQKTQDGLLEANTFRAEYEGLKKEQGVCDDAPFLRAALDRITLESDDSVLIALLKDICGADVATLLSVIDEFRSVLLDARRKVADAFKSELARTHYISGSAVIPNLEKDPRWQAERQYLTVQFEQSLRQEKAKLAGSGCRPSQM